MASKDQVLQDGPYVKQHTPNHPHTISTNRFSRFRFADLTPEMRYVAS